MVPDPVALRAKLRGALSPGYRGMMIDLIFDRHGEFTDRGELLRLRRYQVVGSSGDGVLAWKGAISRTPEGHKSRREIELPVVSAAGAEALLLALGYVQVRELDRYIEVFSDSGVEVRIEWYPRMDVLVEIEGERQEIERGITASGLPRNCFRADSLSTFLREYRDRTGREPAVSLDQLGGAAPSWHGLVDL